MPARWSIFISNHITIIFQLNIKNGSSFTGAVNTVNRLLTLNI